MHCRSCGTDLAVDAAFCSRCGSRVQLGSMLGVGSDLPPAVARDTSRSPTDPSGSAPVEDRNLARETPGGEAGDPGDDGPSYSRSSILAMVATFAVLTIIGTFALTRLFGSDDPRPAGAPAPSAVTQGPEESGDTSSSPSATSQTPTSSPSGTPEPSTSPEVSPSPASSIPAEARRCSTSGSDAVATAYAGTERTSCEFAASVREAYREAGSPSGATGLRAYSPVTKKWYSLSCDGGEPVRCTTTTNAIVYLAP